MTDSEHDQNEDSPTEETPAEDVSERLEDSTTNAEAAGSPAEDELPEEEELTPEFVEEEAVRGDFMLRWSTVFLAILLGFSEISDTRTLIHVRSGESLANNGFLPSSTDTLSYATEGQQVANVSWLFDLLVYAIHSLGGMTGLAIFKAFTAGLIAWILSRISVRGMPSWWSSVCGVFAVVACSVDFVPITDLMTLLGVVCVLSLLHQYDDRNVGGLAWKIPVLIGVWANLDTHAFLGVLTVLLFTVGSKLRQSRAVGQGESPGPELGPLWKATAFSLVALLVNPSPVASVLSGITTYSVTYPGMASMKPLVDASGNPSGSATILDGRTEYVSLFAPGLGEGFEFAYVAGLAIIAIALVVLAIGRDRATLPWTIMLIGFAGLAVMRLHELPAAALVAAVTGGVVAQRWYGRTFRQEYSVETLDVLFSRGGRAVTVIAFAALAFVIVADRVPTRSAIGIGLEPDLATTIDTLGEQLEKVPEGQRIMNTRMTQGDLLIWHGRQSFVDSRVVPFGRIGDSDSLLARFDSLRRSLHLTKEQVAEWDTDPEAAEKRDPLQNKNWLEEYTTLGISQVMIRLAPPGPPAYAALRRFITSPEWRVTSRGASAAFFGRADDETVQGQPVDLRKLAFQEQPDEDTNLARADFGREPDFYEKYVYAKRPTLSKSLREAQHFFSLDTQIPPQFLVQLASQAAANRGDANLQRALGHVLAGPLLTIRRVQSALQEDPQNEVAYRLLGLAYQHLRQTELAILQSFGGLNLDDTRYMQAVMAYRQATVIDPDNGEAWQNLAGLYAEKGRTDLALECVERVLVLNEDQLLEAGEAGEEQLRQMNEARTAWQDQKEASQTAVDEALSSDQLSQDPQQNAMQKFNLAQRVYAQGNTRVALKLMDDNIDQFRALPAAELLRGRMLLETGHLDDGWKVLRQLASFARANPNRQEVAQLDWHQAVALAELGRGDYTAARSTWSDKLGMIRRGEADLGTFYSQISSALPLAAVPGPSVGLPAWPVRVTQQAQIPLGAVQRVKADIQFLMAIVDIEAGNVNQARRDITRIVEDSGEIPNRGMALVYLYQLDDDASKIAASTSLNAWEEFEVAGLEPLEKPSTVADESGSVDPTDPAADTAAPDESAKTDGDEAKSVEPSDQASEPPSPGPDPDNTDQPTSDSPNAE